MSNCCWYLLFPEACVYSQWNCYSVYIFFPLTLRPINLLRCSCRTDPCLTSSSWKPGLWAHLLCTVQTPDCWAAHCQRLCLHINHKPNWSPLGPASQELGRLRGGGKCQKLWVGSGKGRVWLNLLQGGGSQWKCKKAPLEAQVTCGYKTFLLLKGCAVPRAPPSPPPKPSLSPCVTSFPLEVALSHPL